jgi:hypothetical protein
MMDIILTIKFFGLHLFKADDFFELLVRFAFNFIFAYALIRGVYYSATRRKDFLTTLFLLDTIVFLLLFLLDSIKLQVGFALGLFAIFGVLRYRTSQIPIREMTYLFIVIGTAVINALANKKITYVELVTANSIVIFIAWGFEHKWFMRHESKKTILYEKIDLIKPENYKQLLADLSERTGLKITRVEVGRIDFLRDTARLRIYYFEDENLPNWQEDEENFSADDDD